MTTKNSKGIDSKPIVQKPKEKIIKKEVEKVNEEQTEEITEARPIDPEVFEKKLFVEEEPEEIKFNEAPEKEVELVKGDELTEKLKELNTNIEKFQTIQVVPASPEPESTGGLEYSEDYHPDPNVERTLVDKDCRIAPTSDEQPNQGCIDTPESMYTLTKEQEEEGAKAVANMINEQILKELKELKALVSKSSKVIKLGSLTQREIRYIKRTGQIPK